MVGAFLTPKRRHITNEVDVKMTQTPYFRDCKHIVDTVESVGFIGFSRPYHKCSLKSLTQNTGMFYVEIKGFIMRE